MKARFFLLTDLDQDASGELLSWHAS